MFVFTSKLLIDKISALENEIFRNIHVQLSSPWTPQYCNKSGIRKFDSNTFSLTAESTKFRPQLNLNVPYSIENVEKRAPHLHSYWLKRSPNLFQQTKSQNICPSVIHKNDIDLVKEENNVNAEEIIKLIASKINQNISFDNSINNENVLDHSVSKLTINAKIVKDNLGESKINLKTEPISNDKVNLLKSNNSLEQINLEIEKIKNSIEELLLERKTLQGQILKIKESKIQEETILQGLKDERKIKERTSILLENPVVNISKMESIIATTKERMKNLSEQWEEHRKPLIDALEKSKARKSSKNLQNKDVMEQVKTVREKAAEVSEDLKVKTTLHSQLMNEIQKVDKKISRNAYTTRIMEIIGNIRKQKNDIDKVLRDTRELQKEINNITGQLDRQFTVTDDLLYKTAKRDEYSKKAYKLLATLHSDCSELVSLVQETGAVMREVRDLEDQIENEKARNISTNLEKITLDLKQMEKESKELQEKIRKVENQITQG